MSDLATIDHLIDTKRAVYVSLGIHTDGKRYCTIWSNPSNERLASGHGVTIKDAVADALRNVPSAAPVMPGLVTR